MTEKEALERVIDIVGSQSELARQLTALTGKLVRQSTISMWLTVYGGRATPWLCRYMEIIVDFKVLASDLRPDHYGELHT